MSGLESIFGLFCHQLPSRSPHFEGVVFPLCFRCAGLHLGLFSSYLYLAMSGGWRRRLPELRWAVGVSLLMAPFLLDGWGNALHLWSSPGWVRTLTGGGVGLVAPLLLVPLAQRPALLGASGLKPTLPHPAALIGLAALGGGMVWLLVHPISLLTFQTLAIAASAGALSFLINFSLAVPRGDGRPSASAFAPHRI